MTAIIFGIFLILHGIVFLLYSGQSFRLFELTPGLVWPDGSWIFSKIFSDKKVRTIAGIVYILSSAGFIAGGIGIFAAQNWWFLLVIFTTIFSALLIVLFWDGKMQKPANKGGMGFLINLVIIFSMLVLQFPAFEF